MDYVCKVVGELSIEEKDFKLSMSFNEIVDLAPDDFKVSPRLRSALRNREIEVYTPGLHKKAKRLSRSMRKMEILQERIIPIKTKEQPAPQVSSNLNNSDITEMKAVLGGISNKMNSCISRLDLLVTKVIESNTNLNNNFNRFFNEKQKVDVSYDNPKLDNLLEQVINTQDKFNNYIQDQTRLKSAKSVPVPNPSAINSEKLDKLLDSVEKLLTNGLKVDGNSYNIQNTTSNGYSKIKTENRVHIEEDLPIFIPTLTTDVAEKNIVTKSIESEGTDSILEKLKNLK